MIPEGTASEMEMKRNGVEREALYGSSRHLETRGQSLAGRAEFPSPLSPLFNQGWLRMIWDE